MHLNSWISQKHILTTSRHWCPAYHTSVLGTCKCETANMIAPKIALWERRKGKEEAWKNWWGKRGEGYFQMWIISIPHLCVFIVETPRHSPWRLPNVWFGPWEKRERGVKGARGVDITSFYHIHLHDSSATPVSGGQECVCVGVEMYEFEVDKKCVQQSERGWRM